MSETALAHPLVAGYLSQFETAASVLPAQRAAELHEQIESHIDEAIASDASDEEIASVLHRLGAARVLVAEAVAATGKRSWASRLGWKGWAFIGALVLVVAAVAGYYIRISSVGPLYVEGSYGWWYSQDYKHQVTTEADTASQTTVPIRTGQRQGFFVEVFNFTGMTQTVTGSDLGGSGPNGGTSATVTLSTSDPQSSHYEPHMLTYALPVSIPPGESRFLRITWVSRGCLSKPNVSGIDAVDLRVRVGWSTRSEYIKFPTGFYLGHGGYCAS
jgi:hypothetical protein